MEMRIQREIEEKEGLLKDLEMPVDLKLVPIAHHKQVLINTKDYTLKYQDSDNPVFTDLTFTVTREERIALHGKNGCGKSTLIKDDFAENRLRGYRYDNFRGRPEEKGAACGKLTDTGTSLYMG